MTGQPPDWQQRRKAIDVHHSCIVQAPAGSGKTELLTQRLLGLLAVVDRPEQILAITFTRKAAGEMKQRLLEALAKAAEESPPAAAHARQTWELARQVRAADQRKGWFLTRNPARLQVMTIDGLCAYLTRRMPWLSRLGDQPAVTDQPGDLYREAAERLLARIDDPQRESTAQERLLAHLDNRMPLLRDLLAVMLAKRDQWLRHLLGQQTTKSRQLLETGLRLFVRAALERSRASLGEDLRRELLALGRYAAANLRNASGSHGLEVLVDNADLTADDRDLDRWLALSDLTLTASGGLRRTVDKRLGFPADKSPLAREMKARMMACLEDLQGNGAAVADLRRLRDLPATGYSDLQWSVLESLVALLPVAAIELQEVFRMRGAVDFIEIAGGANAALGDATRPEDLLLQMDSLVQHILVDEFQDTSYSQFDLLQKLTAGWVPGDGRTLFIVGDPMQSIYRFREADVGLFLHVCRRGLNDLPLQRLTLTANFRSQGKLVAWANAFFRELFPAREDEVRGAVCFSPAEAVRQTRSGPAVNCHIFTGRQDGAEAGRVLEIVREEHAENPGASVAVLVRSRRHLATVVRAFKDAGLNFQAQDVDCLADRSVVQDLLALTRALVHPADRVAWLAVLRAPWCGLTLHDLHALCGDAAEAAFPDLLQAPARQLEMFGQVSEDGRRRLARCLSVLEAAAGRKGRLTLRRLVEGAWLSLGGPACTDAAGLVDAGQFFTLLEALDEGGDLLSLEILEERLAGLFAAADPEAGAELQVMTIHKAKGLEFDTVIVPGMGRSVGTEERDLLRWLEHPDYELLLAPLPPAADDVGDPTYRAIGRIMKERLE
ncbi:MAG TPA: UvrD-helicase domain-containing protein, partial [Desulfuromonadales bacterium]|nr:UvrD-helicase domain-containing protein [Desulfuromonadales bacterium]